MPGRPATVQSISQTMLEIGSLPVKLSNKNDSERLMVASTDESEERARQALLLDLSVMCKCADVPFHLARLKESN